MPKPEAKTGTVFESGHPLKDATAPQDAPFSPSDTITWGLCSFMGLYASALEDELGIVSLGIGHETRDGAERGALLDIARHWPDGAARIIRDDKRASDIFMSALRGDAFPLHMALTAFQERVLRATCTIRRGEIRSYAWLAAQIGAPKATRAVAGALHRNPVPLIVPCHRVVASGGGLGGYALGTALKTRLLKAEGVLLA